MCLINIDKQNDASILIEEGKKDAEKGYSINEDNAIEGFKI